MILKNQLHPWLLLICFVLSACGIHPPPQESSTVATADQQASSHFVLPLDQQSRVAEFIQVYVNQSLTDPQNPLSVQGLTLDQGIEAFYKRRQYLPAWNDTSSLSQLIAALEDLRFDGLDPSEYSLTELKQKLPDLPNMTSVTDRAHLDILATRACMTGLVHLYLGKLDPYQLESQWNYSSQVLDPEVGLTALETALKHGSLAEVFVQARPQQKVYLNLRDGLRQLYAIESRGGWPVIPSGPTLKPGMTDSRVVPLRQRLVVAGVLAQEQADGNIYDHILEMAVTRFQREQNLDVDGAVGRQTMAVLNVPVQQRIAQLKANLERSRWLLHEVNGNFVMVDIAGYQVLLFKDGKPVWSSRIQVGKPYRKTPIFKSRLTYVTFNPTWTIPPTIFKEDVLPKIQQDPSYLANNRLQVLDSRGTVLDPATIDWNNPGNIMLRESAGPQNPLGQAVIRFPNEHAIYMHDTPSRTNFGRGQRAFSSGCIRVERPLELVELLLNDPKRWDKKAIDELIASGQTKDIGFTTQLPIMLTYSTVGVTDDGRVVFRQDIYDRDPALIAALDGNKTRQ